MNNNIHGAVIFTSDSVRLGYLMVLHTEAPFSLEYADLRIRHFLGRIVRNENQNAAYHRCCQTNSTCVTVLCIDKTQFISVSIQHLRGGEIHFVLEKN